MSDHALHEESANADNWIQDELQSAILRRDFNVTEKLFDAAIADLEGGWDLMLWMGMALRNQGPQLLAAVQNFVDKHIEARAKAWEAQQ